MPNMVSFSGGKLIEIDKVKTALNFYRSSATRTRPLSTMTNQHRFIRTKNDLDKLRNFERDENQCINWRNQMRVLCDRLRATIFDKMDRGIILHDTDIQALAIKINHELHIPNFKASLRWVQDFKNASRIVSRKITKLVTRRTLTNFENIKEDARKFVENIKSLNFAPELIVNADQSGFLKARIYFDLNM